MSSVMRPSGPEPQNTYWLRRVFVALAALLALALLWWLGSALFGGHNDQTVTATPQNPSSLSTAGDTTSPSPSTSTSGSPSASPSASASSSASGSLSQTPSATPSASSSPIQSATPSASPTPTGPATCTASDLALTLDGDRSPSRTKGTALTLGISSGRACFADFSELPASIVVTSGADRIWTSAHCDKWAPSGIMKLAPGKAQSFTVDWPAKRSREGCALSSQTLGAGTYRATATVGGASKSLVMVLHG